MQKLAFAALTTALATAPLLAQDPNTGRCFAPDSIAVSGNKRVAAQTILTDAGLQAGQQLSFPVVQRAIKNVFQGGQFNWVNVDCVITTTTPPRTVFVFDVQERPILDFVDVTGMSAVPARDLKDKVDLLIGRPVDPSLVARAVQRLDSVYIAAGYVLARIRPETTLVSNGEHATVIFRIDEGRRLAISGISVHGDSLISAREIVGAMQVRPEKFWFWQKGEYDQEKYSQDVGEKIPQLYQSRGLIDFQVTHDTLLVDRERGKGLIDLTVKEGPQYKVGTFEVTGNKRFSTDEVKRFYPFTDRAPSISQRFMSIVTRKPINTDYFDMGAWNEGTTKMREAAANEGYIYAQIRPVIDRQKTDSGYRANLRWDINEGSPAIINRIEILGNDFTSETCIRDQLVLVPGDVFSQDRLIRSYQSIKNLGFFEDPLPVPETRQANEQGDVDVIFKVKEKRTGNVNFGASMGQGTGLGGFIGLDQPNLFGKCKKGSVNWQFGQYINDFSITYTDPAIQGTQYSGSATAYRSESRYTIADLGQSTRTGAQVRIGFPFFGSRWARTSVSYGLEAVRYANGGVLGTITTNNCAGCLRSTVGLDVTHDTRLGMPFPFEGILQTISAQTNGGILGGTASFQRYTTEFKSYLNLWNIGDPKPGSEPMRIVAGLSQRAGMVFGNTGPFFSTQEFALGGVQYGEPLRGYPEFSITPTGYNPVTNTSSAVIGSFGNAFFTATAELGLRFNSQVYLDLFYDAGNIWAHPRDFDPTRLFRGTGVGVSVVTPLGPLGLDWAYGMDRVDTSGRPAPAWQLHFRLGQFFQ